MRKVLTNDTGALMLALFERVVLYKEGGAGFIGKLGKG